MWNKQGKLISLYSKSIDVSNLCRSEFTSDKISKDRLGDLSVGIELAEDRDRRWTAANPQVS